jgi:aminoglycoside phosphotransferase (APT) family kinase protein
MGDTMESRSDDAPHPAIDLERAGAWLGRPLILDAAVPGGASNFTWYVRVGGAAAVLRHAPPGRLLPTAHDLAREHRFLSALAGSAVPVPEVLAFCDDPEVAGLPFLLMDRVAGDCLVRSPLRARSSERLARAAVETLAALHAIDWRARGLEARAGSYLERQVTRWGRQLEATPSAARLSGLEGIREWLLEHAPQDSEQTIVHGDFGFHNLLVEGEEISAVLDWELATIGDPLSDLFGLTKGWGSDAGVPNPANVVVAEGRGAPDRDALVRWYERETGRSPGASRLFYEILGLWKSIGILEGIHLRTNGARFTREVPALVDRLRSMIETTRAR